MSSELALCLQMRRARQWHHTMRFAAPLCQDLSAPIFSKSDGTNTRIQHFSNDWHQLGLPEYICWIMLVLQIMATTLKMRQRARIILAEGRSESAPLKSILHPLPSVTTTLVPSSPAAIFARTASERPSYFPPQKALWLLRSPPVSA